MRNQEIEKDILYSVIVPVYNSESSLGELCSSIDKVMKSYSYELILVDDCSKDGSWQTIQSLSLKYTVTALHLEKNRGQFHATIAGIKIAKGRFYITIDDDLQYSPANIIDLIAAQGEHNSDLIYGIPRKDRNNFIRKAGSKFISIAANKRKGSSFRLIHSALVQDLNFTSDNEVLLDVDLHRKARKITYVEVEHYQRKFGKSGYTFIRLVRIFFKSLFYLHSSKK